MSIEQELNAPVRPGSTGLNQEEPGKFPFEAFEFDLPTETAPTLYLKDPWKFKESRQDGVDDLADEVVSNTEDIATNAAAIVVLQENYETSWINRSDWTNVHLGSNTTLNTDSNVAHSLGVPLSDLLVKVLISTDGTDNNSFEVGDIVFNSSSTLQYGITISQIDSNNIELQTAVHGIRFINADGNQDTIDIEDYYYKIVVKRII